VTGSLGSRPEEVPGERALLGDLNQRYLVVQDAVTRYFYGRGGGGLSLAESRGFRSALTTVPEAITGSMRAT
jgi:hypothetical protein